MAHGLAAVIEEELIFEEEILQAAILVAMESDEEEERWREEKERLQQPTRVEGYFDRTIPLYNLHEFKSHFRMERASFEQLVPLLGPHLTLRTVPVEKKLLATLWLLGNKKSFRSVADRFDLNKGYLHGIVLEVCAGLRAVRPQFLNWPDREEQSQIENSFLRKTGFPEVVGCIDGSHIPIPGPSDHRAAYINRKGFPSIQMQAVCDDNLRFLDVIAGWPGSVHDARVFRNSPLYELLEAGNVNDDHHLLGDSAYALTQYIMVPFRDNGHLTEEQVNYNTRHSSARMAIERSFGLLKSKFRRLHYLDMRLLDKIPLLIMACCVLHNFILVKERIEVPVQDMEIDDPDDLIPLEGGPQPQPINQRAALKREMLVNLLA
ncbi:hypothetical protein Pmani_007015 [Petrolisthes manimaculis]|uniref:Putative nuclease HARBI1 n=1 Tax=Petrolisthes manimaculis TaxID=1843537 RepID=A0AAE1UG01_9EUCA|nr:hypothetical protein Pmani_007015 [Petrolisthes manimaculis]